VLVEGHVLISDHLAGGFADDLLSIASLAAIDNLGDIMPFLVLAEVVITRLGVKKLLAVLVISLGSKRLVRQALSSIATAISKPSMSPHSGQT
jgi:hypothetical protein